MTPVRHLVLAEWDKVICSLEILVARHFLMLQNTPNALSLASYEAQCRRKCDEYRSLLTKAHIARADIAAGRG